MYGLGNRSAIQFRLYLKFMTIGETRKGKTYMCDLGHTVLKWFIWVYYLLYKFIGRIKCVRKDSEI